VTLPGRSREDLKKERRLFGLLLFLQAALYAWLILGHRIVKGHDTLHLYLLEYLFLAHASQAHDVALWIPNMTHGLVTSWLAGFHGGLLQNARLLLGGVPEGANLLPHFYLGLFLDELVLLVGVWSLGRRYYSSPYTRFFVAAAMIGSSFWANHVYFNLRFFNAVPLILSLLHGFIEERSRWKLFLGINLAVLQFTGNIPYVAPLTCLVVLGYFLVHALVYRNTWRLRLESMKPRLVDLGIVVVNGVVLAAIYLTLSQDTSQIQQYRPGRNSDASVPLDVFLTFGGNLNPMRYLDLLTGVSPSFSFTLYCGVLTVACALLAVLHRPGKKVLCLVICLLLSLLFSMGFLSIVGMGSYYLLPPLRFFRYISLAAPIAKLFLILLAGFGFEALLDRRKELDGLLRRLSQGVGVVASALIALLAISLRDPEALSDLTSFLNTELRDTALRPAAAGGGGAFGLLLGTALATTSLGILLAVRASRWGGVPLVVPLILGLHTLDVFRWKTQMFHQETLALEPRQFALQEIRPIPYLPRRQTEYESSERYRTLRPALLGYGAIYDHTDPFLHLDPPVSHYENDVWLAPFDKLLRAHHRQSLEEGSSLEPRFRLNSRPSSPEAGDPYAKIIGLTEDKLQVFRGAHVMPSDQALADLLNHPGYRGDILLISPSPKMSGRSEAGRTLDPGWPAGNERLPVRPQVLSFDFNHIALEITLPPGIEGAWLEYSDVWHPGWTASVNGRKVGVERAFLAYKAVPLEPGSNRVEFRFISPLRTWGYRLVHFASLAWVVGILILTFRLFFGRARPEPAR